MKLDKRTLVLKAASSAWRSELFLQKKAIIDRCNTLLGEPFIQAIRFA
ncbi:DciA family protein [Fibrobacter succinogenes]|nr:DciA family protein [Fibrobacter succinogenes]